ncbi:MAG: ribonuclease H-like YkuK family protein [Patescibacteria group bacterium]|nr:ribonuclease H-like YkuK family protein [Patescibacteria group bacterium]
MAKNEKEFNSSTYGRLSLDEVLVLIKSFLEENPDASYSIVIGTDSEEKMLNGTKKKSINLITAIVIYRKGFGGRYFWKRKYQYNIHTLREKIYAETVTSLEFATMFVPMLKKSLNGHSPNYDLEIHIDVGEHGATREMIREVVGMVTGNGFVAKTKPFSYAASNIADKHT